MSAASVSIATAVATASDDVLLTRFDHDRLGQLLEYLRRQERPADDPVADALEEELQQATLVASAQVPATVVTMNSMVTAVDPENGRRNTITLVFPRDAQPGEGRVSVLAPLGLALLGARVGQEISWSTPRGTRRLRVERIDFQPEAAGRFDL